MSGELQAKLLRVIQEGEFERLGGTKTLKANVRLIAATNRDLHDAMDTGDFRADLYYRISSFPIDLPPLRDRKEDIPMLAEHLVQKHAKILGKDVQAISARMLRYLQAQDWPGNIRELEGLILRALISNTGTTLDYVDESGELSSEVLAPQPGATNFVEAQRSYIVEVLSRVNWVIEGDKGAARALGLAPSSLRSKMKRLDIVRPE
jgi:transcriptional regulator with GAF, ATPase, and Fis domain